MKTYIYYWAQNEWGGFLKRMSTTKMLREVREDIQKQLQVHIQNSAEL